MKNIVERLKDFLYDAVDYVLIIVIVLVVGGVIGWRLDILFAKDMDKAPIATAEEIDNNIPSVSEDDQGSTDADVDNENDQGVDESQGLDGTDKNAEENHSPNNPTPPEEFVTIKIPSGTLPPTIADILIEKGLITDKWEFLSRSQELKLDTKLKSGEFKIKLNSSLDAIIQTIAK